MSMGEVEWEVLNPEAEYEKSVSMLAPRLTSLSSKKIGLFWNGKPSGDILLDEIGNLLQGRFKNVELVKFNLWVGIGAENVRQMADTCDAVVAAIHD